jgi:hypothetical protein
MNELLSKRNTIIPFIFSITLTVVGFYQKKFNEDEVILAEHSYRLVEEGVVRSELFNSLDVDWGTKQYHFHKLYI